MVLTLTSRCTPRASTIVTTAGSPSGTAATASEMAVISISTTLRPWIKAMANNATHRAMATTPNSLPKSANRFCSGVVSSSASLIIWAILPISVSMPVLQTMPSPRP